MEKWYMSGFVDASFREPPFPELRAPWAAALDLVRSNLLRRRRERFTGSLHLDGNPGGSIWVSDGLVVAASTSSAPGAEPLLLRSGRMTEAAWNEAYGAGAASGDLPGELAEAIGVAGVEVVSLTTLFDAVFAMALCGVDGCRARPADPGGPKPLLPVRPGLEPDRLVRETERRLRGASSWADSGVTMQSRPISALGPAGSPAETDEGRRAIVARANGRRTPRDIAFSVGRGLFPVLADIAALVREGALLVAMPGSAETAGSGHLSAGDIVPGIKTLPRRRRGASGVNDVLPPPRESRPLLIQPAVMIGFEPPFADVASEEAVGGG